jgi:carboxymethylenebutenolidase
MDQRIINLFDEYTHKPLKREDFMKKLIRLTGSLAVALSVLPLLEVNYAQAATVPEDDKDLLLEDVTYPGDGTTMKGYLARPKGKNKLGTVMVIHENRGLNPHIKDVTRRMAKEGFLALAPDALSPFGGTPADEAAGRDMFGKLDARQNLDNFLKGLSYLRSRPEGNKKTGVVGFCWGGAMANQLAVHDPALNAAVAYYGRQADAADAAKIKASLLLHYGGMDERVNAGIPAYEAALKAAGVDHTIHIYEGAQHAFNNDTAPTRYNAEVAKLAWDRTVKLFKDKLK